MELRQGAASRMVFKAFRITPETDAAGYFIQEKHVTVTLMLFGLQSVQLAEIMEAGIVFSVDFERDDEGVTLLLKASYGYMAASVFMTWPLHSSRPYRDRPLT